MTIQLHLVSMEPDPNIVKKRLADYDDDVNDLRIKQRIKTLINIALGTTTNTRCKPPKRN